MSKKAETKESTKEIVQDKGRGWKGIFYQKTKPVCIPQFYGSLKQKQFLYQTLRPSSSSKSRGFVHVIEGKCGTGKTFMIDCIGSHFKRVLNYSDINQLYKHKLDIPLSSNTLVVIDDVDSCQKEVIQYLKTQMDIQQFFSNGNESKKKKNKRQKKVVNHVVTTSFLLLLKTFMIFLLT